MMPYLVIFLVLLFLISYITQKLRLFIQYLHTTYALFELHMIAIVIAIAISIYFLLPIYHRFAGKKKQKEYLENLIFKLSNNNRTQMNLSNRRDVKLDTKPLPKVIENIALITSSSRTAQAEADFSSILLYGNYTLYNVPMSENNSLEVKYSIIEQIKLINNLSKKPDIICIIRGGGTESVLKEIFDDIELAITIETSSIPVLTAIGHAKNFFLCDDRSDNPVIDDKNMSIKKYFITPTHLAYFLNEHNADNLKMAEEDLKFLKKNYNEVSKFSLLLYFVLLYVIYGIFY